MLRIQCLLWLLFFNSVVHAMSYTLQIDEEALQERVDAMMPLEQSQLFVRVRMSDPKVDLIKGANEIRVDMNIRAFGPGGLQGSGVLGIKGSLSYNEKQGAFYLKNPELVHIEIAQLPAEFEPTIKEIADLTLKQVLVAHPVYRLEDDDKIQSLAKATLSTVEIKDEILNLTFNLF